MAHAYTPGLRVTGHATVLKQRRLPIAGKVLVSQGCRVSAEDIVAHAELPGDVSAVNVVNQLGIAPGDLPGLMLKKEGDAVARGEVIAETRPLIKWFRAVSRSPIAGTIETVSHVTGQVMIRTAPKPVDVRAYIDGTVVEVFPGEGVAVETTGALVQGILGIGGEVVGEIAVAGGGPKAVLEPKDLTAGLAGKIVVAGALITRAAFDRAASIGVAALVCGGFHDLDLRDLLGYDLGVAITGHENIRPVLIITEGFGSMAMAAGTHKLLAAHAGRRASANGATQIRAGVLRPEIIIPGLVAHETSVHQRAIENGDRHRETTAEPVPVFHAGAAAGRVKVPSASGLTVGSPVRIIREPGFGRLGSVKSLPPEARAVESEAKVRVVELEFTEGDTMIVPRANVEAIES